MPFRIDMPILPIVPSYDVDLAVSASKALEDAGLTTVEIVLRAPAALDCASAVRKACPGLILGIGTVTTPDQIKDARLAGAQFLVTPGVSRGLLEAAVGTGMPLLPGTSSASDLLLLRQYNLTRAKFFPAGPAGGVPMLQALADVFPDIIFCPTGNITDENMSDYLALPCVFSVGGTWLVPRDLAEAGKWGEVTDLARASLARANTLTANRPAS